MTKAKLPQHFIDILMYSGVNPLNYEFVKSDFESFTVKDIRTNKVLNPIRY